MRQFDFKGAALALALVGLAACVDSPSAPLAAVDATPLASSFESLAEEMRTSDIERSEELRWAAIAVRAGVTPSVLELTNNGVPEIYDAFVHAVRWASTQQTNRPLTHRNLVAWRRQGSMLQVMLVGLATDSAPVVHPYSLRPTTPGGPLTQPILGAKAAYFERGPNGGTSWIGVQGHARVEEVSTGSPCVQPDESTRPAGVACQQSQFDAAMSINFARTPSRDSREVLPESPTRWINVSEQRVVGVKLLFSCQTPLIDGCR